MGDRNGAVVLLPPTSITENPVPPQEYQPSIFYPARSADALHRDLTTQCEKMDIPFLSFLPTEVRCAHPAPALARPSVATDTVSPPQVRLIDDAYGLVVDAVLGPGVRLAEAGGPCARALATLKRLSIPLVSLDVPSGTPPRGSLVTLACFFHPSQILPSAPPHPHHPVFLVQLFQPQFPRLVSSCFTPALVMGCPK